MFMVGLKTYADHTIPDYSWFVYVDSVMEYERKIYIFWKIKKWR